MTNFKIQSRQWDKEAELTLKEILRELLRAGALFIMILALMLFLIIPD